MEISLNFASRYFFPRLLQAFVGIKLVYVEYTASKHGVCHIFGNV